MLLKLSASGDSLWSVVYGNDDNCYFNGGQETADHGFIMAGGMVAVGNSVTDAWLVKTDALGIVEWTKTFSGVFDYESMGVVQTADLGFTINIFGALDTTDNLDMMVIHTDANGDMLWSRQVNGLGLDVGFDLIEISAGEYLIAGATKTDWDTPGNLKAGW